MNKNTILSLSAALFMGGCSAQEDAQIAASGHKFHDALVAPLLEGAGRFATGYTETAAVQPVYVQPIYQSPLLSQPHYSGYVYVNGQAQYIQY